MNHGKYAPEDKHAVAPADFRTVPLQGKEGF
jgi:hypothetical protein